jgi:hypothetical protein
MEGLDDAKSASNPDEEEDEDSVVVLMPAKGSKKPVKSKAGDNAKKSKKSKK